MQYPEGHGQRPTSFFIEDILLNKPKPTFRELPPSLQLRPTVSDFPGYPYFPGIFYPHQVLHQTPSFIKHPEHPFLMPSVAGEYTLIFKLDLLDKYFKIHVVQKVNYNIKL